MHCPRHHKVTPWKCLLLNSKTPSCYNWQGNNAWTLMSERMFFLLWWQVRWIGNLNLITFALAERELVLVLLYAIVLCFVCLFCSFWYVFNNIHTFCLEVVIILFYHYFFKKIIWYYHFNLTTENVLSFFPGLHWCIWKVDSIELKRCSN